MIDAAHHPVKAVNLGFCFAYGWLWCCMCSGGKEIHAAVSLLSIGSTELVFSASLGEIPKLYYSELDRTVILSNDEGYLPSFGVITDGKTHDAAWRRSSGHLRIAQ